MTTLSGWGRYPRAACRVLAPDTRAEAAEVLAAEPSLIPRGQGRSYGDAALNPAATLRTGRMDRIRAFDPGTGRVTAEAGMTLADLLQVFVPRGWFPPVTPGTRFVSIGGMVAADVHGKNHHRDGSFGDHVESLELLTADGRVLVCSETENAALFRATRGGMGLTGVILSATFRLRRIETAWIRQETLRCRDLAEAMALFEESAGWTYTVAWIDCLAGRAARGRSILYRGEHAGAGELPAGLAADPLRPRRKRVLRVPFDLPSFTLNGLSVRAFNALYYGAARPGTGFVDYETFFYPLDAVLEWNRIYGTPGFVQYQCVLPKAESAKGLDRLLGAIAASGQGSFLAVLKLFGAGSGGPLSFPMEGYTLALDFRASPGTFSLLRALDRIVAEHGGRLYLAKDACMGAGMLRRGYPGLDGFRALRARHDPDRRFRSLLSDRLDL